MKPTDTVAVAILNQLRPRKPKTVATLKYAVGGVTTDEVEKALGLLESAGFARSVCLGIYGDWLEAWCCTNQYWFNGRHKMTRAGKPTKQ